MREDRLFLKPGRQLHPLLLVTFILSRCLILFVPDMTFSFQTYCVIAYQTFVAVPWAGLVPSTYSS